MLVQKPFYPCNTQRSLLAFMWCLYCNTQRRMQSRVAACMQVVLPAMRQHLKVPFERATDGTVVQVAALEQLYRVFERC